MTVVIDLPDEDIFEAIKRCNKKAGDKTREIQKTKPNMAYGFSGQDLLDELDNIKKEKAKE